MKVNSRLCSVYAFGLAFSLGACNTRPTTHARPADSILTTVTSESYRLSVGDRTLRVAIRDVDMPDQPLDEAVVSLERVGPGGARSTGLMAKSSGAGMATLVPLDSGEFSVVVHRLEYEPLRFGVRLRTLCRQVLEIYLVRAVPIDSHQVTVGRPAPDAHPTRPRVVFTTCAPAA